jgi:2-polyprenyl-3-methyl-5-hydroxy-6-metoxy-1,4-benzoquinol methylase
MTPGRLARVLLGERGSRVAGRAYRALFVDLGKAADAIAAEIPPRAHVLDVGGGDGEPLNALLDRRDDIRVTTIDVAPAVGQWIEARHAHRVRRLPATRLQDFPGPGDQLPDVLLIADVAHHIPVAERDAFFAAVAGLLRQSPDLRIVFKDVEPGHARATLGYLSDRFVSGDRSVRLIGRDELVAAMRRAADGVRWKETSLFAQDRPNYALVFWR